MQREYFLNVKYNKYSEGVKSGGYSRESLGSYKVNYTKYNI
jgi:hypothetical protein